ncbi:hypothetical protein Tco_1202488 [Tanacetum coccineum]
MQTKYRALSLSDSDQNTKYISSQLETASVTGDQNHKMEVIIETPHKAGFMQLGMQKRGEMLRETLMPMSSRGLVEHLIGIVGGSYGVGLGYVSAGLFCGGLKGGRKWWGCVVGSGVGVVSSWVFGVRDCYGGWGALRCRGGLGSYSAVRFGFEAAWGGSRKHKFICHWANPFKDFERSNIWGIKLSSFSESDDTFMSLQALSNLHYLLSGFMDYFWSRELNISNFAPANR